MKLTTLKHFTDRINKRIYRKEITCKNCKTCEHVGKEGLIIGDDLHAWYLEGCSQEMGIDYYDKKEDLELIE